MDCSDVIEKLAEYLDEADRNELCKAIEEHLRLCHDCRIEVDSVKKTIVLYQADREVSAPIAVNSRLEAALAQEYVRGTGRASTDPA